MRTNIFKISILSGVLFFALSSCIKDEKITPDTPQESSDVKLVINEIFSNSDTQPDWFEVYNPGDESVDMSGFACYDKVDAKFTWPNGTSIPAKGHLVLVCDKDSASADPEHYANFKLSSGGESLTLLDADGKIIDELDFPALDVDVSYSRIPDGSDNWEVSAPTRGTANSNENNPPQITADTITNVNDNSRFTYNITVTDPSGVQSVNIFYRVNGIANYQAMAPLGSGQYSFTFPYLNANDIVDYYVEATDVTGLKSYFAGSSPDDNLSFTVLDGAPVFEEVSLSPENPDDSDSVLVSVKVYDRGGIDQVKVYYLVNDTDATNKTSISLSYVSNNTYEAYIPAQVNDAVVRYYFRAKDNNGNKAYYPAEDENFNHDFGSTWPSYTVAPLVILNQLVINEIEGNSPDYIELYNGTDADINLEGYSLEDSDSLDRFTFPAGTVISAHGFIVLDCTGTEDVANLVAGFKISSGGEDVTLRDPSGNIIDQLLETDWPAGHSGLVGRIQDAADKWVVLTNGSKGSSNNQ